MAEFNESIKWDELDPGVVPLVRYFNENGLPTTMSCEGHNKPNMSIFWIEFDKTVSEEDILKFQRKHLNEHDSFCSCGRFARRLIYGTICPSYAWNYYAANVEAANQDLRDFQENKRALEARNEAKMPYKSVAEDIEKYDHESPGRGWMVLIEEVCKKYSVDRALAISRLLEVRQARGGVI